MNGSNMKYLVTGAAGFIGFFLSQRLCSEGHEVVGLDNLNHYYDVNLKRGRLEVLSPLKNFRFVEMDLSDREAIAALFRKEKFNRVIHLAAQAGVRYSIENPMSYVDSNLVGHACILEGCRHNDVEHLVYASSSSIYGMNSKMPFSTRDAVDHPISLYAATKKSNELMSHTYSHLYNIPATGLRFFTVYGPWGRPDMAYFKFTQMMERGEAIPVFNEGKLQRDFTYIDDIIEGVMRIQDVIPTGCENFKNDDPSRSSAPYRVYNIGNNQPVELMSFIEALEDAVGMKAKKQFLPMQAGDVYTTYADVDDLMNTVGFKPSTSIQEGLESFARWYKDYSS